MRIGMMLAALAMAGLTGSAQATVQTYDFTAILESVGSFNELSWTDSGEGAVSGTRVNKGDIIKGRVSFDDATPYSSVAPWPLPDPHSGASGGFYYNGNPPYIVALNYTILGIDQRFSSIGGSIGIENNLWDGDALRVDTYADLNNEQSASIALINSDGSVFGNGTIPKALSLNDFDRPYFNAQWHRSSDDGLIFAHSILTEFTLVNAVPEPASSVMVLSGLALAGLAARRGRKAKAAPAA